MKSRTFAIGLSPFQKLTAVIIRKTILKSNCKNYSRETKDQLIKSFENDL